MISVIIILHLFLFYKYTIMKTATKYMASAWLALCSVIPTMGMTYATDYIDWDDTEITLNYDYSNEELDIRFSIDENSTPGDDYSIDFEIDWDDYSKDLMYSSSSDVLYFTYSIDIDEEDLEDDYEIDFEIINEDENDDEHSDSLDVEVSNFIDWSDVEVTDTYYSSSEYIYVVVAIENMEETLSSNHYSYFEIDGSIYSSSFVYSSSADRYYATHKIYIDKEDLDDEYDYELTIKNKSYEEVYEESDELDTDYSNYSTSSTSTSTTTSYSSAVNALTVKIKKLVNQKYTDTDDKVEFIEKIIDLLDERIDDGNGNSDFYEELLESLEDMVDTYESWIDSFDFDLDEFIDWGNNTWNSSYNSSKNSNYNSSSNNNYNSNNNSRNTYQNNNSRWNNRR